MHTVTNALLTAGDEHEGSTGISDAGGGGEDGGAGGAVGDGLVDANVG